MKKPASFTGTKNNGSQAFSGLQAASSWTGLDNTPIPSISTSNTSPCFIQTGGLRAAPTPPGVPMMITSPGFSVMHSVISTMVSATPQINNLRRRILRAFVGRGLIERCDAKEMLACQHSGFSVDAGVCIEARDRAALERLLRYCARPPFAMDRLRKEGAALVYRCAKQHSEPAHRKSLSRSRLSG